MYHTFTLYCHPEICPSTYVYLKSLYQQPGIDGMGVDYSVSPRTGAVKIKNLEGKFRLEVSSAVKPTVIGNASDVTTSVTSCLSHIFYSVPDSRFL